MNLENVRNGLALVISFALFQTMSCSQSSKKMTFVEYENVMADLQSSDNLGELRYAYDYIAVLLLDSSKIDLILQTGFQDLEEFRDYAYGLSQPDEAVGFVTNIKDIKKLFYDQKSLKRILECTQSFESSGVEIAKFDYPIYVKGDEAVFEISGPTWTNIYFARLENGIFQINWLGGTIEFIEQ